MKQLDEILKQPVLPVLAIEDPARAVPLAQALMDGGLDTLEVTFRTEAAAESLRRIRKEVPAMHVGAGTLITPDQARSALDCGVEFGLAPGLDARIIRLFQERDIPFMPGVMTPSDIQRGIELGCLCQKFFPAETSGGVAQLKAMAAPFKSFKLRFCPTGGITLANLNSYLALPEVFIVGGSWLATPQQIAAGEWARITEQVRASLLKAKEV
ncbi:MAG: bifunctional 4-hydroxy-2-oxoglutarate aldolase/2-dehydro-3-deoxy-phosphogluconate aldolase [Verrucomicrobia bacterium]|jgi:2-dehydro-3-deoxyphosphogluconate aldolase/(4S)-4-hydroxy-2-oxoglutarate aldolase|nr:bifunctional 4-hydroxy-2-oxoglutarate aldolase/2-dehydro-3-deoxy-phosphogluconate aldolase [Verrucomicrobiota bacterium]